MKRKSGSWNRPDLPLPGQEPGMRLLRAAAPGRREGGAMMRELLLCESPILGYAAGLYAYGSGLWLVIRWAPLSACKLVVPMIVAITVHRAPAAAAHAYSGAVCGLPRPNGKQTVTRTRKGCVAARASAGKARS
jgi:hypothetical protein